MTTQQLANQYANRDAMALDEQGGYYIRHVCAMTKEHLHSKSDIAAELAYRDMIIDQYKKRVNELLSQRNSTGIAIDNAMLGILPDEHPILSRLKMIANVAVQRDDLLYALKKIASVKPSLMSDESQQDSIVYHPYFNPFKIARNAIALQEAEDKS